MVETNYNIMFGMIGLLVMSIFGGGSSYVYVYSYLFVISTTTCLGW
jgi:hypothetical protein